VEVHVQWIGPGQQDIAAAHRGRLRLLQKGGVQLLPPLLPITQHRAGQVLSLRQNVGGVGAERAVRLDVDGQLAPSRCGQQRVG